MPSLWPSKEMLDWVCGEGQAYYMPLKTFQDIGSSVVAGRTKAELDEEELEELASTQWLAFVLLVNLVRPDIQQCDETGLLLEPDGAPLTLERRAELLTVPPEKLAELEGHMHTERLTEAVAPSGLRILNAADWWDGLDAWKAAGCPNAHGEPTEPVDGGCDCTN